jgi:hypothetical protein
MSLQVIPSDDYVAMSSDAEAFTVIIMPYADGDDLLKWVDEQPKTKASLGISVSAARNHAQTCIHASTQLD